MTRAVATPRAKLPLLRAFAIGYGMWILPWSVRMLFGSIPLRRYMYDAAWIALFFVLSLSLMAAVYRFASERGLSLKVAAVLSLVASVPTLTLAYLLDYVVTGIDPSLTKTELHEPHTIGYSVLTALCDSLTLATMLAALVFLPAFAREHEQRRLDLEALRRDAELLRLKTHLEPHFVLNTLNAVAGLVQEDPPQARELLAALGDLFRDASTFHSTHSVREEIEWLRRYVTIHELRHPDLLRSRWEVEPEVLDLVCPALIMQPLVENAVKHGALRGGGEVVVNARIEDGMLVMTVGDDGEHLGEPRRPGGRGLSIVQRRLALDGLRDESFELVREGGRTVARLRLTTERGKRDA